MARRQWQSEDGRPFQRGPVKARPRKAADDYSYHLQMLQERNRLLRKLCQKDPREEDLERKEQGFSLYLNGANMAPRRVQYPQDRGRTALISKTRRPSRTAGSPLRADVKCEDLSEEHEVRSKTAPSKRKSWSHNTVEVKSQDGPTVPVAAPGIFTGCYDDDFEFSAAEDEHGGSGDSGEGDERGREGDRGECEEEEVYRPSDEESVHTSHSTSVNQDSLSETNDEIEEEEEEEEEEGEGEGEVVTVDGSSQLSTIMATQSLQSSPPTDHPTPDEAGFRSNTLAAATSSGDILTAITERIKRLDSREQKELLRLLSPCDPPLLTTAPQQPSYTPDWLRPDMTIGTTAADHVQGRAPSGRPVSTRLTGLRGEIMRDSSEVTPSEVGRSQPPTRPASDRLTGLRGMLATQTKEASVTQPSSAPDLHCPEHRPGTAVLAEGHRPLKIGPLDTDLVPLPTIDREEGDQFDIPILPEGQQLVLNLLTTWGDQYYVGLTGIEMFTASGERASVREISADPPDINILPEYCGDPRVVTNLLDGVNQTRDDLHMWLAPFTPSHPHTITITFTTIISLALLRIWNYNKSHVHSYRGVRDMQVWLDNVVIFQGEVSRASGGTENFGEMILFTTDEEILSRVGHHDDYFQTYGDSRYIEDNNEVCLEVGTEGEGGGEEEREGGGEGGHTELY